MEKHNTINWRVEALDGGLVWYLVREFHYEPLAHEEAKRIRQEKRCDTRVVEVMEYRKIVCRYFEAELHPEK